MSSPVIIWFRHDLRLADNPALVAAAETGQPVVALFVWDESQKWGYGAAQRWWLHHSLTKLAEALDKHNVQLVLRSGDAAETVSALVAELGAKQVFWNRRYSSHEIDIDKAIKQQLQEAGVEVKSSNASLLHEPWQVKNKSGEPFRVFSPMWKSIKDVDPPLPLAAPKVLSGYSKIKSDNLDDWGFLPSKPNWAAGFASEWQPGEEGAKTQLDTFLQNGLDGYGKLRDRPDLPHTSRLSPHLAVGEVSPRQIWYAAKQAGEAELASTKDVEKFLSEVAWREFAYQLIYNFPTFPDENYRSEFDDFPWAEDVAALERWQQGQTGYPIVDAGMRELWHTGWMHNRVRMIVASFLIKDLLIHWREGEKWFWDTLLDADIANNSASWQWVAGSGADAAPYFRVFNPVTQGERFDPEGDYVRRWCPELAKLKKTYIHKPWEADPLSLAEADIELGTTYPEPMVNHQHARQRALAAFEKIKKGQE